MSAAPLPETCAGLTTRPLRPEDARAVYEVIAAQELHDLGVVEIEEADIVGDWQRPSFDLASSTVGVFDGDTLVAYAELTGPEHGDVAVVPGHRGRGLGTWLAGWMQDRARAWGSRRTGMPVPLGSPGDALLAALGYQIRWTSWVLKLPAGAQVVERSLPDGYLVRPARGEELAAIHEVVEDAFLEWSERERSTLEDFRAVTVERPGFEPWHLLVVLEPGGTVVGVAQLSLDAERAGGPEVYVARLAVRREHRGRGLAQALLVESFARGREHGATSFALSTDTRTGALGLYERVGMVVTSTWLHRTIELSTA